jgi:hypothetical protein
LEAGVLVVAVMVAEVLAVVVMEEGATAVEAVALVVAVHKGRCRRQT